MKYELKKLWNSTLIRTVVFVVAVVFSALLFSSLRTVTESELQRPEDLTAYKIKVADELKSLESSSLFQTDEVMKKTKQSETSHYEVITEPKTIQKTYTLCFDQKIDLLLCTILLVAMFYTSVTYETEEGYATYMKMLYKNKKGYLLKRFVMITLLAYIPVLIMFVVRCVTGCVCFGTMDLSVPIQSVNGFLYCPYSISIGVGMLLEQIACLFYLFSVSFWIYVLSYKVSDGKSLVAVIMVVSLLIVILRRIPYQSVFVIFKLLFWCDFQSHLSAFHSVNLFGSVCMSYVISIGWFVILSVFFLVLLRSKIHIKIPVFAGKKEYTAKSLFRLEVKKLFRSGTISILLVMILAVILLYRTNIYHSLDSYYANYYLNQLEGVKSQEKDAWIKERRDQYVIWNEEMDALKELDFSSETNAKIATLQSELNKEGGFRIAADIYERSGNYLISFYLLKTVIIRPMILFLIAIQIISLFTLIIQFNGMDRKMHIEPLMDSISEYEIKKKHMHRKIITFISILITCLYYIRIIMVSEVYVNTSSTLIKTILILILFLVIIAMETVMIRLITKNGDR